MKRKLFLIAVVTALAGYANNDYAQGMAVNTSGAVADNSAMLDVSATTQGMLMPRMDSAQRASITTPATGLLVYQTDGVSPGFYFYSGTTWTTLTNTGGSTGVAGGDLTGTYPNPTIAAGKVTPAKIHASGTPSATTYLRGDSTWSTPPATEPTGYLFSSCWVSATTSTSYYYTINSGYGTSAQISSPGFNANIMTDNCIIDGAQINLTTKSGSATNAITFTLYDGTSGTSMTGTVTASATPGATVTGSLTGNVSVSAGDIISWQATSATPATSVYVNVATHCR